MKKPFAELIAKSVFRPVAVMVPSSNWVVVPRVVDPEPTWTLPEPPPAAAKVWVNESPVSARDDLNPMVVELDILLPINILVLLD